jgi:hypothetical protein
MAFESRIVAVDLATLYGSLMRKPIVSVHRAAVLALVVACAPSAAELKTARATMYKAPPATLFATMKAVTEDSYKTAISDENALALKTEASWYTPEGQMDTMRGGNLARLQNTSINLSLLVRLVKADADSYTVSVEPIALRLGLGSKPERVDPSDPSVPGWVTGKVESLQVSIYQALKRYARP